MTPDELPEGVTAPPGIDTEAALRGLDYLEERRKIAGGRAIRYGILSKLVTDTPETRALSLESARAYAEMADTIGEAMEELATDGNTEHFARLVGEANAAHSRAIDAGLDILNAKKTSP